MTSRSYLRYGVDNGGVVGHKCDVHSNIRDWPQPSVRLPGADIGALVCGGAPVS